MIKAYEVRDKKFSLINSPRNAFVYNVKSNACTYFSKHLYLYYYYRKIHPGIFLTFQGIIP